MLTRLLKDNGLLSLLLTLAVSIVIVVFRATAGSIPPMVSDQLGAHWALGWARDLPKVALVLSGLMVILSGFLTRTIAIRFKLLGTKGWLPVLISVALMLVYDHMLLRPDMLLAIILAQVLVYLILGTYKQESVLTTLFHAGLLSGLAAIMHGPSILLMILVLFSIFIMRPGNWREWFMPLLGLSMTLVFLMIILVWHAQPFYVLSRVLLSAYIMPIGAPTLHWGHFILMALVGLSLSTVVKEMSGGAVLTRNGMLILLALIAVAFLAVLAMGISWAEAFGLASFPAAILVTSIIERAVAWWWADMLLLSVLLAVFAA
jgi:hypothetical protein